jgi:cell division septation protein DedD
LTEAGRLRVLVIGVLGTAGLLVVASRWAGRAMAPVDAVATPPVAAALPGDTRGGAAGAATEAGAAAPVLPDLSFYRKLSATREGAGAVEAPLPGAAGAPAPGGGWVVQALATRDAALARRMRDRIAGLGLPATLSRGAAGGGTIYRIRVGRYLERSVAETAARTLRTRLGLRPWVLREDE